MYATQKNRLSQQEFDALTALTRLSKNLFNVALYECRQYFFQERKRLSYESNYHICKSNENYQLLNTDIAQQTMKVVDRSMRSFLGLLKAIGIGRCDQKAQLPKYLPKEGYFPLIIPRIRLKGSIFNVPMSREFKKEYGAVKIQLPERLKDKKIKEVRIHPKYSARWFEVEYIYEDEKIETSVDSSKAIALDVGVNNLCACIDTDGHQFLIDGKRLKSINQWYNKQNAYFCSRYGIEYLEQEESYTSRASFYDRDEIPVYNADNPSKYKFSGRRIRRGLYKTKDKHLVSSDLNGSANILAKCMHRLDYQ